MALHHELEKKIDDYIRDGGSLDNFIKLNFKPGNEQQRKQIVTDVTNHYRDVDADDLGLKTVEQIDRLGVMMGDDIAEAVERVAKEVATRQQEDRIAKDQAVKEVARKEQVEPVRKAEETYQTQQVMQLQKGQFNFDDPIIHKILNKDNRTGVKLGKYDLLSRQDVEQALNLIEQQVPRRSQLDEGTKNKIGEVLEVLIAREKAASKSSALSKPRHHSNIKKMEQAGKLLNIEAFKPEAKKGKGLK